MKKIKLARISAPAENTRAIFKFENDAKFVGAGDTSLICSGCERVLAENITDEQIRNLVFLCASCGTHNEVPTSWNVFQLVDIQQVFSYPPIILGILLFLVPEFTPYLSFGHPTLVKVIGVLCVALGAIVSLYQTKLVKYFKDSRVM